MRKIRKIENILCTTDFSEYANNALDYAIHFAEIHQAKLFIMHVREKNSGGISDLPEASDIPEDISNSEREKSPSCEMESLIDKTIPHGLKAEPIITVGTPCHEIIKVSRERNIDLIVIATHGRAGFERVLFGSTTEKVVRDAPCPVLTIKSSYGKAQK